MLDRLTAAELRELLVGAGWETRGGKSLWMGTGLDAVNVDMNETTLGIQCIESGATYTGPLPSTPADLWALLRCVGAPVPDLRAEAAAALDRLKEPAPPVHEWAARLAADGVEAGEGERRHAEHPEMIPCKLCGEGFDGRYPSTCSGKSMEEQWTILHGRRSTDWRKGEGK
jgi:hypothetical protein